MEKLINKRQDLEDLILTLRNIEQLIALLYNKSFNLFLVKMNLKRLKRIK